MADIVDFRPPKAGLAGLVAGESDTCVAGEAGIVLNLFFPSATLLEEAFVRADDRAVRGVLGTAAFFELSVVDLRESLELAMGFLSAADVLPGIRRAVEDSGGLFSASLEAAGVMLALRAAPPTSGFFVSEPGLEDPFLTSSTELNDIRDRWVGVGVVVDAAGRRTAEDGGGRVGGLLKVLPVPTRLLADAVIFEAVAGVGAVGLFGAVRGRFGGTAVLFGGAVGALLLDDSANAADISSSIGTSDSIGSSSLTEAMINN